MAAVVMLSLRLAVFAQEESSPATEIERVLIESGFVEADVIPAGVTPILVSTVEEAALLVNASASAADLHVSDVAKPGSFPPVQLMTVDYREWLSTRTCSRAIGLASFNGHLEARIGMWNGLYLAFRGVTNQWWTFTGLTGGHTISNVVHSYILSSPDMADRLTASYYFTVSYYVLIPVGPAYFYSENLSVSCTHYP
jgi:hypothetical protein